MRVCEIEEVSARQERGKKRVELANEEVFEEVIEDLTFRSKRRGSSKNILIDVVHEVTKEVDGSIEVKSYSKRQNTSQSKRLGMG